MHHAMLQATKPLLSPLPPLDRLLTLTQGLHPPARTAPAPTCLGFAAPAPTVRGQTAGWGQSKQLRSTHRTRDHANNMRGRGGKGSRRPLLLPQQSASWRGRQSHLRCRINPSGAGMGHYRVAVHSSSSRARRRPPVLQIPKFPGTGHRHPQPLTSAWAQTCRKCYCNINN